MSSNPVIRVLDLGYVSPVRSQTVYHAVAYAMTADGPDTIILVSPNAPYVCIGYHQELDKEVDVDYCSSRGLPVVRREVGGGAVYLDKNQLFAQWVFRRNRLPAAIERRFELYVLPLVETYRTLGIDAYLRPVNDVHVAGRKIGGTGAASIGEAEIVVGSLMFDFDFEMMARVLRVPSEKMRDKVHQSLREYMTTMARELEQVPDREMVKSLYLERCRLALGRELALGSLSEREETLAHELDERFVSAEWLNRKGGLRQDGVKIHEDVRVVETAHKAPGGLIRVTARLLCGRIDDVSISGDFTLLPVAALGALEEDLRGANVRPDDLVRRIRGVYQRMSAQSPGVAPEDFVTALMAAIGEG